MEVEKMRKFLVVMLVGLFLAVGGGVALGADAGTLTINSTDRVQPSGSSRAVRVLDFTWLSDASGDCSRSLARVVSVTGTVVGLHAIPSGSTDDNYDVTLIDNDGVDVLNGAGTDLPQSATSAENYRFPVDFLNSGPIVIVNRDLSLVVAGGGNADTGTIRIYILLP